MAHLLSRPRHRLALASALLLAPSLAAAAPADPRPTAATRPAAVQPEPQILKHLPASHDDLVFRGENAVATWPVFFTRAETTRVTSLQIGLLNTVSLLPDRSVLKISINGRPVTSLPIHSPDKVSVIPVRLPAGVLVPGFNAVQVSVAQMHRVDCSTKATYELWTLLDPAQTGFLVPQQAAAPSRTIDELAGEPLAEDGTTRIHLRIPADAEPRLLQQSADLVDALVAHAHLVRPVVDVGPEAGSGPGFDVSFDTLPADAGVGASHQGSLAIGRSAATGRLTVSLGAAPDLDAAIADIGQSDVGGTNGHPLGLQALDGLSGLDLTQAQRISFASLGLRGDLSSARRLTGQLGVTLPSDFFAGNYGTAELDLDGVRAPGLLENSSLVFRVNGTLVSSLPLGPGSSDRFDHTPVELPLRFFRPGYNEIAFEGTMRTASDDQCELNGTATGTRLTIADTSELVLPHVARFRTMPQIAAALAPPTGSASSATPIYLTERDANVLGAAFTVAANRAARVTIVADAPSGTDRPGIVVGPLQDMPDAIAARLRQLISTSDDGQSADKASGESGSLSGMPLGGRLDGLASASARWLRQRGFFYAVADGGATTLPFNEASLLVADLQSEVPRKVLAGVELPRLTREGASWTAFTAQTGESLEQGLRTLVSHSGWKDLVGQAVVVDGTTGRLKSRNADTLTYVVDDTIAVSDIRPVLGGMVSNNILLSAGVLLVLLALLGLSTHAVLRFIGERQS